MLGVFCSDSPSDGQTDRQTHYLFLPIILVLRFFDDRILDTPQDYSLNDNPFCSAFPLCDPIIKQDVSRSESSKRNGSKMHKKRVTKQLVGWVVLSLFAFLSCFFLYPITPPPDVRQQQRTLLKWIGSVSVLLHVISFRPSSPAKAHLPKKVLIQSDEFL